MNEFDIERFLEITFDIMGQIAENLIPIKKEIRNNKDLDNSQKILEFQLAFRKQMGAFQGQMVDKYNLSFTEYNENAAIYKYIIEEYLKQKPQLQDKYMKILKKLKFEIFSDKKENTSKPSRFPLGIDKF